MQIRNKILGWAGLILGLTTGHAGTMGTTASAYHPVVTVFGGVTNLALNSGSHAFVDSDDNVFRYRDTHKNTTAGLVGVFAGGESKLFAQELFLHAGIEYNYFGNAYAKGINTVGIEPDTSTVYQYRYTLQTQQLLAVGKLFKTVHIPQMQQIIYPYLSLGLGAAFNRMQNYQTMTNETEGINLTASFPNQTHTSFSYNVGIGVDCPINEHARIGVGYKFSDFLKTDLNKGHIIYNQYAYPVSFSLQNTHTYANQFVVQASYVI